VGLAPTIGLDLVELAGNRFVGVGGGQLLFVGGLLFGGAGVNALCDQFFGESTGYDGV
jgi:hypothetical protein